MRMNDSHIETRYTRDAFKLTYALVAHRDRVTASEAVGRGFESLRARHKCHIKTYITLFTSN